MNKNKFYKDKEILLTSLFFYDKDFFRKKIIYPLFYEIKKNIEKKTCKYCKKIFDYKLKYCITCIEKMEYNYHFGGRI
tara:strand:+ start:1810 stop:2043 length:234 start_codon:yes stop_codon:yes gene_type:complete